MKTANKCPKCKAKMSGEPKTAGVVMSRHFYCQSFVHKNGLTELVQSALCRERVKVAKLKKQVERLKERAESAEWAVKELQKTEAELAEADRVLAIHKRDYEAHFKAHQEELAEAAMLISQYTRQKKQRRRSKRAM